MPVERIYMTRRELKEKLLPGRASLAPATVSNQQQPEARGSAIWLLLRLKIYYLPRYLVATSLRHKKDMFGFYRPSAQIPA